MATQTIGTQGGVGDTSVPKPLGFSRHGSLYSLTLDEVQNQLGTLGKPLGSLNIDELLRTVEANQTGENGSNGDDGAQNHSPGGLGGPKLSRDLKDKTVEEVWREIQQGGKSSSQEQDPERQNTLGEMTLEDFLTQAGIAIDNDSDNNNNAVQSNLGGDVGPNTGPRTNVPQHAQWMPYRIAPHQQQPGMMTMFMPGHAVPQPISVSGGAIAETGYSDPQLVVSTSPIMGTLSDTQAVGRKRTVPPGEKTIERRQKRMIKNRESAARSRARKQAYTNELENKVSQLEEENKRLRKMMEVEKALPSVPPPLPKFQLRRTSSSPI